MRRPVMSIIVVVALAASAAQAQGFKSVWVAGPGDIWAVGSGGTVVHGTGGAWRQLPSGTSSDLRAVWGSGPADVWIVGDGGTILRWNGSALSRVPAPLNVDFIGVSGCSAANVYVIGQSEDERQPPPLLRWTGTAWAPQTISVAFRPSGIGGACPSLAIAGTAFFDPRPDQRRNVGVLARLQAGAWVTQGWNGQRITDEQLGGTPWTGVSANGGVVLLRGGEQNDVLLLSGRTGWTRLPAPPAGVEAVIVTGDGSPVLVRRDGFARLAAGQWRTVGQQISESAGPVSMGDSATLEAIQQRMERLAASIPEGGMPTAQQLQELQRLQAQMIQAMGGQTQMMQNIQQNAARGQAAYAEAMRASTLQFGDSPAVFAARSGSDFYVATGNGSIMHVTGDESSVVYSPGGAAASPAAQPAADKPARRPAGTPRPARRP